MIIVSIGDEYSCKVVKFIFNNNNNNFYFMLIFSKTFKNYFVIVATSDYNVHFNKSRKKNKISQYCSNIKEPYVFN